MSERGQSNVGLGIIIGSLAMLVVALVVVLFLKNSAPNIAQTVQLPPYQADLPAQVEPLQSISDTANPFVGTTPSVPVNVEGTRIAGAAATQRALMAEYATRQSWTPTSAPVLQEPQSGIILTACISMPIYAVDRVDPAQALGTTVEKGTTWEIAAFNPDRTWALLYVPAVNVPYWVPVQTFCIDPQTY